MAATACSCGTAHGAVPAQFIDQSFHVTERLGKSQALTPDGFLVCEGVPIARTGVMIYQRGEVPLAADGDGQVHVFRGEDEVFSDTALNSFVGKPVTINHPPETVNPRNWRKYAVGSVQNVRRGEGDQSDLMIADLLIQDPDAIQAVRDGLREVSCGYDADYEADEEPGRGRQKNIIGNHLALVPNGRCGPRCAIGDARNTPQKETRTMAGKGTLYNRLMAAFHSGDENAIRAVAKDAMGPVQGEPGIDIGGGEAGGTAAPTAEVGKAITVNIHPGPENNTESAAHDAERASKDAERARDAEAAMEGMRTTLARHDDRITGLENRMDGKGGAKDAEAGAAAAGSAANTGDAATVDSAALELVFKDVMARAEVLAPGVQTPTFDAAQPQQVTLDSMCALRRRALAGAPEGVTKPFMAGRVLNQMSCDAVAVVFDGAVELARMNNNALYRQPNGQFGKVANAPRTPAEINAANRAHFAAKKGA